MTLTYRGVRYPEDHHEIALATPAIKKEMIYRGVPLKPRCNPKFPWLSYIKQLLRKSESRPVLDPITFWYNHKRKFVEDCWRLDDLEKLEQAWDLTVHAESVEVAKTKPKTKLKYRGVTYYR